MEYMRSVLVAIYISFSILIIAANLVVIFAIFYSPLLRLRPRNHIIISIALADLLLGSFVTPMIATTLIESSIEDCSTHVAIQVIGDHGIFFVVGWEMVTFNLLHIRENSSRLPLKFLGLPNSMGLKSFVLVFWPWFAAICILVPLISTYAPINLVYSLTDDVMCMMRLPQNVFITVCFFSLYLPFYLCVAALVTIAVCYGKGSKRQPQVTLIENTRANLEAEVTERLTNQQDYVSSENLLMGSIPNTVYLVCYTPLMVYTWLHFSKIYTPNSAYGMIVFGLLARSVILPLSWVAFKDIREELKQYETRLRGACCLCVSNPLPSTTSSVSFSRLQETQTA